METNYSKQEERYDTLVKSFSNYKKSPKERVTISYIEARLENLEKVYQKMCDTHQEIITHVTKAERVKINYFIAEVMSEFEELYFEYKGKMKGDLARLNATVPPLSKVNCEVKLPQINLPCFTGGYDEWQTFYDMFVSLIHDNANLSAVQKLHYLKSSLSGEPANLLKNLSTTEMNYYEAWKQLIKRYNNKRYNVNEIMKRLFSQKTMSSDSAAAIKQLLDTTSSALKSLNNLGVKTENWDIIINHLVVSKLDSESRKQWEIQISQTAEENSDELPTWKQLTKFLEMRFRTLEMIDISKQNSKSSSQQNSNYAKPASKPKSFHSTVQGESKGTNNPACVMCNEEHKLYQCKLFSSQSPQQRSEFIQSKRLCFNCLAPNHSVKLCRSTTSCRRCGRRHHSLLHFERSQNQDPDENESEKRNETVHNENTKQPETKLASHFAKDNQQLEVLLATAMAKAKSTSGQSQIIRALIDQGSEASFVTEGTAQSLGLKRVNVNGVVSGVGDGQTRTKSMVSFTLQSLLNPQFSVPVNAFVLSTLTSFLPTNNASIIDWPELEKLPLADPQYGQPNRIDLILGVDILSEILLEGLKKHPAATGPIAQNTQLGWILSGRVQSKANSTNRRVINLHLQLKEDQILKKFWDIEREPERIEKRLTEQERKCEEFYEKTTERDEEGRYVVRLPFKDDGPQCLYGHTREISQRRFKLLEKRLLKNPTLRNEYTKVIDDYVDQKHMTQIINGADLINPNTVYLPHHAVVREDKETTKVRAVFDASCKGSNNVSLNDCFLVGPKLQQDLRHILMRWRGHQYCIISDLVQMYRQIRVHDEDTDYLRILWRSDPDKAIDHYRMLRLTFGTACAPYLAVKSLQQLAKDEQIKYPNASEITLRDFYMDDLLTGCDTEEETLEIFEQMNKLMSEGGFRLQKWCTNSEKLQKHIKHESQKSDQPYVFKTNDVIKVLGICWNKESDTFEYLLQLPEMSENFTKRQVLSDIARLYDPMGWIAPVIVTAKIFMQLLWKSGLNWDDELTPELTKDWIKFRKDLTNVEKIVIPRWLRTNRESEVELHAFADASQAAYGASVYLKSKDRDGNVNIHLVTAKTKVAPIDKQVSIPRLELCAALLAAQLLNEVSQVLRVPKEKLHAWSDSTVVLAWLKGEPSRWTTFVSNRVSESLTILDKDQWRHVNTTQNPADCASRGISANELKSYKLWWQGPEWLQLTDDYNSTTNHDFKTDQEQRSIKALTAKVQPKEEFIWAKFSNLQKMLRIIAYCRRFLLMRVPIELRQIPRVLTSNELEKSLEICIRDTQNLYFLEEIKQLKSKQTVAKSSNLHTLCPILDNIGVIRVGGRIEQSQEPYNKKHPIIMPSESHLTKLIISEAHVRTLHGGPQLMLNYLRSKFWILRGREKVKRYYRECVTCTRYAQRKNNPFMGQLPAVRVKPTKPFKSSGVDFTGHINIRFSPGRGSKSYKGYICVFICMCTRAIHLEAVSSLTSEGFIAAFRRFISRRGHCQDLYSDNGTNFVGADKELREMFNRAKSRLPDEIGEMLAKEGTTWHFIPPQAPNFGGLWEAGVRSTKAHLKKVIGDSMLTYEELATVLTQIEACLNSRPICQLSDNPDDPLPLTPGHFLVGEPTILIPDEDYSKSNLTSLQRWKITQKMVTDFWRKWSDEYLVTLNQRFKWTEKRTEPEIDDIVIVKDPNLPPAKWLLGRIIEKHTGLDKVTRVVTIKTKNGICKRACNRLCFLPKTDTFK